VSVPSELFDDDYLFFYQDLLGAARSDADAARVISLLGLAPGDRVLDAPCGEGRIAGRLAAHGCEVVGVDASELFLRLGRERYPAVDFRAGDLRSLSLSGEFDAVVNWFTSFGYFDPAANDRLLAAFARALRPGGRLLIELLNPGRLARILELTGGVTAVVAERDGDLMVDRVRLEGSESVTDRFIVRGGRVRRLEFRLEQVHAVDLERRLRAAGFASVELLGVDGQPFDPAGPRLIGVATR
jgi:SAM-dependent methyltransferase